MMSIGGYFLGFGMGVVLGLLGAGGSILTVPILVYFFGIKPQEATAYSLLIVGLVALTGAIRYSRKQQTDLYAAMLFFIPAMLTVFCTRCYLLPIIPDPLLKTSVCIITKDIFIMLLFGLLMILSSVFMFKRSKMEDSSQDQQKKRFNTPFLFVSSGGIGVLTGLVGAGGGFLIVPALVGLFNLPVQTAVGTSLTIIAVNSLVGFNGDLWQGFHINWSLIVSFLFATILGMLSGTTLSQQVDSKWLSKAFAYFTLIVGIIIIGDQLITILHAAKVI